MKSVRDANLEGKTVFLRVDYNVPMENGKILDNNRIRKSIATVKYILEHKAKIIIATHLGKPKGKIEAKTSTIPLASELAKELKHKVIATDYLIDDSVKKAVSEMKIGDILMLGNLRWNPGEESNDAEFAKELASLADIYVNDAFGASHRAHASIEAITKNIPAYAGFLLESEVTTLSLLLKNPVPPFMLIMGGAKIEDKAGLIENLADKVDKILVGGGIANTFLKAKGEDISKSLYEPEMVDKCRELLSRLQGKIVLPVDSIYQKYENGDFSIMDIGYETRKIFSSEIAKAKTIFWNGNMGKTEDKQYEGGSKIIAQNIADNEATSVVAGGDTVGFVLNNNLEEGISFISTGGGAALEFLAGLKLPGVESLNN
jgi:phosphoglycerate kinase